MNDRADVLSCNMKAYSHQWESVRGLHARVGLKCGTWREARVGGGFGVIPPLEPPPVASSPSLGDSRGGGWGWCHAS